MNLRAAIYLRISKDANEDGLAIERQRGDCEAIAKRNDWTVIRTYSDTLSAYKRDTVRPEYERMRADFEAGEFDVLVAYDLDRLTRQPRQLEDWIELAEVHGLTVVTANGEADLRTESGRLFARIKASVARSESEAKSRRQTDKNLQSFAMGKPRGGKGRFGFQPGNVKADPVEGPLVLWLFEEIASGGSINSAAKYLRQVTGDPWSPGRVRQTLANRAYEGKVQRGEWENINGHKKLLSTQWAEAAPEVDRIVSAELGERVRALLNDPTRHTGPGPEARNVLSGIAKCGVCGSRMKVISGNYSCAETKTHPTMTKRLFEARAAEEVFAWYLTNNAVDDITAGLGEWMKVDTELKAATQERTDIQDLYLLPGADKVGLARKLAEVGQRIETLTNKLNVVRSADARLSLVDAVSAAWDALPYADEPVNLDAWVEHWDSRPLEERRAILRSLFRITLDHGKKGHPERARFERIEVLEPDHAPLTVGK